MPPLSVHRPSYSIIFGPNKCYQISENQCNPPTDKDEWTPEGKTQNDPLSNMIGIYNWPQSQLVLPLIFSSRTEHSMNTINIYFIEMRRVFIQLLLYFCFPIGALFPPKNSRYQKMHFLEDRPFIAIYHQDVLS